jgi:uncharacterized protein
MNETLFTPYAGLIGGGLIGLAAVVLMGGVGRIMGASGVFNHLLTTRFDDNFIWRAIFIAGLLIGAAATKPFAANAQNLVFQKSPELIIFGGLAVGIGTVLGNGCTSGHGICGIARFSMRSIVATIVFMAVAIATVYVTRHVMAVSS